MTMRRLMQVDLRRTTRASRRCVNRSLERGAVHARVAQRLDPAVGVGFGALGVPASISASTDNAPGPVPQARAGASERRARSWARDGERGRQQVAPRRDDHLGGDANEAVGRVSHAALGGCRIRLHGLHGRSTRTMRWSATSGRTSTASMARTPPRRACRRRAARCIGPVSPVEQEPALREDAREDHQVGRAIEPAASARRQRRGASQLSSTIARSSAGPPVSTTVASIAREPAGGLGKAFRRPLLDRARPPACAAPAAMPGGVRRPVARATPAPTPAHGRAARCARRRVRRRSGGAGTEPAGRSRLRFDERRQVGGDVARCVARHDVCQQWTAACHPEADASRFAPASPRQRVRADVALEVDREVVVPAAPATLPRPSEAADGACGRVAPSHGASRRL